MTARSLQSERRNKQTMKHVMTNERINTKTIIEMPGLRRLGSFVLAALSANKISVGALALLLGCGLSALAAESGKDNRAPEVPADISVGETNKVHFHGFGVGFQIYTWNGTSWGGAVPDATLFDDDGNIVAQHFGIFDANGHFVGPAWRSNNNSETVNTLPPTAVTMDTDAIP